MERYFANLRAAMPGDIEVEVFIAPAYSTGVTGRLRTIAAVRKLRADVVHVTGDITFAALGRRRRGTLLTILDSGFLDHARGATAVVFRWLWVWLPARRAERIVAISSTSAFQFAGHAALAPERVGVIPVTVDEALTPQPDADNDTPILLCFAQTPNKNFARLLEAVRDLPIQLHVVGLTDTADLAALRASAVPHTVSVDLDEPAMRAAYAEADLVVFASTSEGFGMPIVEAQAVGRPVVTSNRMPMIETAGPGGACLVDPESVASIRAGIQLVLEDANFRAELVANGLENRERFRPGAAAEAYAAIYREMAAGS